MDNSTLQIKKLLGQRLDLRKVSPEDAFILILKKLIANRPHNKTKCLETRTNRDLFISAETDEGIWVCLMFDKEKKKVVYKEILIAVVDRTHPEYNKEYAFKFESNLFYELESLQNEYARIRTQ